MQQTDKYQLNLIEPSDTFSPAPLNENAQKLEEALQGGLTAATAHADAGDAAEAAARVSADAAEAAARQNADAAEAATRAAADAALDQRIQVFEARKFVIGHAELAGEVYLGFRPRMLWAIGNMGHSILLFDGWVTSTALRIEDYGFYHNGSYANCYYAALL